jgi:parallel beta-helix repeat protein
LIGENKNSTIIDAGDCGNVIHIYADWVNISRFTIQNSSEYIYPRRGIGVFSEYNTISNNIIKNNFGPGIYLSSSNNIIYGNSILNNSEGGIYLWHSNNNSIYNNDIMLNIDSGIILSSSSNNIIYENNIIENNDLGIIISYFSNSNILYHNNFINNTENAHDECNNTWDDGYPSGGNYWDDHQNPVDEFSGPNQNIPGSDGIVDTPYDIPSDSNQDFYPFMNPWMDEPNNPPYVPSDPIPVDLSTGVVVNPEISVLVSDPDGDAMDVSFYDASGPTLIETVNGVTNGTRASVVWSGLDYGTTYYWYAMADDGEFLIQSDTWEFTTMAGNFHSVYGYVYIDDIIAPSGIEVKIEFPGEDETDFTDETGFYDVSFLGHDWETGYFYVYYDGSWYIPIDNQSVDIEDEIGYIIDLHIDTASTPRIVYGVVYIDGTPTNGVTVELTVPSQGEFTNISFENGNYVLNFVGNDYEECTFLVQYLGDWYIPTPPSVDLEDEIAHNVDLYVDTGAPPITQMGIIPSSDAVNVGDNFTATIYIDPVEPIGGWQIYEFNFTQGIVNVTEITPGSFWETNFDSGDIDNENGTITDIQTFSMGTYPDVNHTACMINFTALQLGICTFEIIRVDITDDNFEVIPVITHTAMIDVVDNMPPVVYDEYPENESMDVERPPTELRVTVDDPNNDTLDVYIKWKVICECCINNSNCCYSYDDDWITVKNFTGVANGTYEFIPSDDVTIWLNDWIWGNTTYIWSVNVTDGTFWTNETYQYTTGGSRYDVNNNDLVNFQDAGLVWVHRTSEVCYDGLYDVNQDGQVNFQDAGLTWVNRD